VVKTKVRLSERIYRCEECGLVLDRDLNAARNLAALVDEVIGGMSSQSCVGDGKRARWKPAADPTPCGQRVPPREGPRGQRRAQGNGSGQTFTRLLNGL
jgi:putative transposase